METTIVHWGYIDFRVSLRAIGGLDGLRPARLLQHSKSGRLLKAGAELQGDFSSTWSSFHTLCV